MEWLLDEGYVELVMETHNELKAKHPQKTDEEVAAMLKPYVISGYENWKLLNKIKWKLTNKIKS